MACLCLFLEFRPYKGSLLCGGRVCAIFNCSRELFVPHALFYIDGHTVYSHVIKKCGCGVQVWWEMIYLVGASCFYTCLKNPTLLALPANCCTDLPNSGGEVGFWCCGFLRQRFFNLILCGMSLVTIPETILGEVEGHAIFMD